MASLAAAAATLDKGNARRVPSATSQLRIQPVSSRTRAVSEPPVPSRAAAPRANPGSIATRSQEIANSLRKQAFAARERRIAHIHCRARDLLLRRVRTPETQGRRAIRIRIAPSAWFATWEWPRTTVGRRGGRGAVSPAPTQFGVSSGTARTPSGAAHALWSFRMGSHAVPRIRLRPATRSRRV